MGQSKITFRGVVTDIMGAVITNATVTIHSADCVRSAKTNTEGRFEFAELPTGRHRLEVAASGFETRVIEDLRVTKAIKPLSVELSVASVGHCGLFSSATYEKAVPGEANLRGSVRDYSGPQLTRVKISISRKGEKRLLASQISDEKGEFEFHVLEPDHYVLKASLAGYWDELTQPFSIAHENVTKVNITLVREGTVIICE